MSRSEQSENQLNKAWADLWTVFYKCVFLLTGPVPVQVTGPVSLSKEAIMSGS